MVYGWFMDVYGRYIYNSIQFHYGLLVVSTHLKNMKVNGKDDIPYIVEK